MQAIKCPLCGGRMKKLELQGRDVLKGINAKCDTCGATTFVEWNKGHWIRPQRKSAYTRKCSLCGETCYFCGKGNYKYCPNCGKRLEGEVTE